MYDEQYGLKNIKDFEEVIISVKNLYDQLLHGEKKCGGKHNICSKCDCGP